MLNPLEMEPSRRRRSDECHGIKGELGSTSRTTMSFISNNFFNIYASQVTAKPALGNAVEPLTKVRLARIARLGKGG